MNRMKKSAWLFDGYKHPERMREHRNYPGANPEYQQTMGLNAKDLVQGASFF